MIQNAAFEARTSRLIANPYNISLDSLQVTNDSVTNTSITQQTPTFNFDKAIPNTVFKTETSLFYLILVIIFGISITGSFFKINLLSFLKIGFFERFMLDHEKKQVANNTLFNNILFISFMIFFSTICYVFIVKNVSSQFNNLLNLVFIFGIIIGLVLLKIFIHFLFGKIFDAEELSKAFLKIFKNTYSSNALVLSILSLIMVSVNQKASYVFFIITIILFLVISIYKDIKFILKQKTKKPTPIYFFLYFCSIEILSLPLIIKSLYLFVNHIFV